MSGVGRLEDYRAVATLKKGAGLSIELAENAGSGRFVLKRWAGGPADGIGRSRFEREMRLAAALRHPGLPAVAGHGPDWIAFEYLAPSLADEGSRIAWSEPVRLRPLLATLADTLAFLHARGIVHRDLKPAHVLFSDEQPVIIDLGVAGLVADDPLEGSEMVGSPAWMAPEQIFGAAPRPAADCWSLAAVGIWLLQGRRLYAGAADAVLEARRAAGPPDVDAEACREKDAELAGLLISTLGPEEGRSGAAEFAARLRR